jgi:serine protease AprX
MTMAKQPPSEKRQRRVVDDGARTRERAAVAAFDRLVGERAQRARRHQGALQVALALASVTSKVRVDTTAEPFETTPADLFARRFDDPRIGVDDRGMAAFLANLRSQLPAIASDLARLPPSARVSIGDVATFVGLSLTATRREGRPAAARPERAPLAIVTGPLRQAREQVRDRFGTHFAAKSSDALLLAIAGRPVREGVALAIGGPAAPTGAVVVELKHVEAPEPAPRADRRREKALREAAVILDRETPGRRVGATQVHRQTQLSAARDAFYKEVAPLYAEIGSRMPSLAGRESRGSSARLDMCWLNETIRAAMVPGTLTEVAADGRIERFDLPRRLTREMNVCGVTVGAPAFRRRTGTTGNGIVIAVIDGEVDTRHPALAGRVMQTRNFTGEPFGTPDSHGTAVAGIIGASDARFGGIAPAVSILSYKIFASDPRNDSDDFGGALAIQQALEDGAHIANCSWGAGPAGNGTGREAKACDRAWDLGMVVVKSAGNSGPGPKTLTSPADARGVIVVGATDRQGRTVQPFSSRGPAVVGSRPHLAAPGGTQTVGVQTCRVGGGFGSAGAGTSFAAPVVSGLAALLLDQNANLAPDAIRGALIRACTPLRAGDANTQGAGLVRL